MYEVSCCLNYKGRTACCGPPFFFGELNFLLQLHNMLPFCLTLRFFMLVHGSFLCQNAKQKFHIKEGFEMDKYECPCGYVYDPAEGDPDNGIPAGTSFADLPEDWLCPVCDSEKEFFEKV